MRHCLRNASLFEEEGLIHFDLFANLSAYLLSKSKSLTAILCDAYPVIILDEFQDTNSDEWNLMRVLGERSKLIALADAEQRIYEFRGADPARIGEFISAFDPTPFDFENENNRSNDTDIVQFGNDLLTGTNKGETYKDVKCQLYPFRRGVGRHLDLKVAIIGAYRRLKDGAQVNWSLAVLVPSNNFMLDVSAYLGSRQELPNKRVLPAINHEVAQETAGPALSAVLIAGLLESGETDRQVADRLIHNLCEHIRGRKGDKSPPKADLKLSNALMNYLETRRVQGKNRELVIGESLRIAKECRGIDFSGDPAADWLSVRKVITNAKCEVIKHVAIDAHYIKLLHKGSLLRSSLANLWRNNGNYSGASDAVRSALLQEHFAASTKVWSGIHVMTMHKAKGKEFDEVIIYEGYYQGKIIRNNASSREVGQALLNLRVSVTRAIKRTTILTPSNDVCKFLH